MSRGQKFLPKPSPIVAENGKANGIHMVIMHCYRGVCPGGVLQDLAFAERPCLIRTTRAGTPMGMAYSTVCTWHRSGNQPRATVPDNQAPLLHCQSHHPRQTAPIGRNASNIMCSKQQRRWRRQKSKPKPSAWLKAASRNRCKYNLSRL